MTLLYISVPRLQTGLPGPPRGRACHCTAPGTRGPGPAPDTVSGPVAGAQGRWGCPPARGARSPEHGAAHPVCCVDGDTGARPGTRLPVTTEGHGGWTEARRGSHLPRASGPECADGTAATPSEGHSELSRAGAPRTLSCKGSVAARPQARAAWQATSPPSSLRGAPGPCQRLWPRHLAGRRGRSGDGGRCVIRAMWQAGGWTGGQADGREGAALRPAAAAVATPGEAAGAEEPRGPHTPPWLRSARWRLGARCARGQTAPALGTATRTGVGVSSSCKGVSVAVGLAPVGRSRCS